MNLVFRTQLEEAARHLSKNDPILAGVIAAAPLPDFTPHTDYYRALTNSIIGQQLSVKAAATIKQRFANLFGDDFPAPEQIIARDIEELRSVGLSRPKARYVQDLAQRIIDGSVRFDTINQLSNDEIIAELTAVKGVGEWTVHMFLLFCMGRMDVLPTGDLGIRNGIKKLYGLSELPTPDEVRGVAAKHHWHPYESAASWYVWHSLDNAPK
jgi:DNA-3-methyladenine glycosylase II